MQFTLAKPGMLKHFEGQWTVTAVEGKMRTTLPSMCLIRFFMSRLMPSLSEAAHCKGLASPCRQSLALQHLPIRMQACFPA